MLSFNLPALLCKECKRYLTYLVEHFAPRIFIGYVSLNLNLFLLTVMYIQNSFRIYGTFCTIPNLIFQDSLVHVLYKANLNLLSLHVIVDTCT